MTTPASAASPPKTSAQERETYLFDTLFLHGHGRPLYRLEREMLREPQLPKSTVSKTPHVLGNENTAIYASFQPLRGIIPQPIRWIGESANPIHAYRSCLPSFLPSFLPGLARACWEEEHEGGRLSLWEGGRIHLDTADEGTDDVSPKEVIPNRLG